MVRRIYRVALCELRALFYSPIAWLVIIIFLVQSSILYGDILKQLIVQQETKGALSGSLTSYVFGKMGIFGSISDKLYLFVPFLTMGLMSREYHSGSVKLLFSSPVSAWEIVAGKYLGILVFVSLLIASLGVIILAGPVAIVHLDMGFITVGLTGLFLLGAVYSAIGLFVSCLTSYQVVAAVSTLVLFSVLGMLHSVGQSVNWIRDITYYLDVSARLNHFISGLVVSRDLFYFVLVVLLFIGWSWVYIRCLKSGTSIGFKVSAYISVLVAILALGSLTSKQKFVFYIDATHGQVNTVSPEVQNVLRHVKDKVTITTYVNVLEGHSGMGWSSERNKDKDFFENYQRFLKEPIDYKYVYYYGTYENENILDTVFLKKWLHEVLDRKGVDSTGIITEKELGRLIDLSPEKFRFVRLLTAGGDSAMLRVYNDFFQVPFEKEVGAAFNRLNGVKNKVVFLTGHGERSIDNLDESGLHLMTAEVTVRDGLINNGFDIAQWSPDSSNIPAGTDIMVIPAPKLPYSTEDLAKIQAYVNAGGRLLVLSEPGSEGILNPVLQMISLRQPAGSLVQQSEDHRPSVVVGHVKTPAFFGPDNQFDGVMFKSAAPITPDSNSSFRVSPLIETNPETDRYFPGKFNEDSSVISPGLGTGPYNIAVAEQRTVNGRDQRVVAIGDVDWMSSGQFQRNIDNIDNGTFFLKVFRWLSGNVTPVETYRVPPPDSAVRIDLSQLSVLKFVLLGVIPFLLFVAGSLLLRSRRSK